MNKYLVEMLENKTIKEESVDKIKEYTLPIYHEGKESYVYFYAYHPERDKLVRKKIHVNWIKPLKTRREFVGRLIANINRQLKEGWNPFINESKQKIYTEFSTACDVFLKAQRQLSRSGVLRIDTYRCYSSDLQILNQYNELLSQPIKYLYQFTKEYIKNYLEYLLIHRENKAVSVNNRLTVIHLFCAYLVEKNYLPSNPAAGIKKYKVDLKRRKVIAKDDLDLLRNYAYETNKHFLLACYLIYYCFIRPKELTFLKIYHVNLAKNTITVDASFSKNRKDAVITLPQKVKQLMIDLEIDLQPKNYYLIGKNLIPGESQLTRGILYNKFRYIRNKLGLSSDYQLYSLKDTGITEFVRKKLDSLSVRDQARHHSIALTNKYIEVAKNEANEVIINLDGNF